MILLLVATCAADPVARQATVVDKLFERGRDLLKDAPPSTIRRTGMAISKIAKAFPDSTFAAVANTAMERMSSVPTLTELHTYALKGQLPSVIRSSARRLVAFAPTWRRSLQDSDDDFNFNNLAGELTKLKQGGRVEWLDCKKTQPPKEVREAIESLIDGLIKEPNIVEMAEFTQSAWDCFCGLTLDGRAGDKIQAAVDTLVTNNKVDANSLPAATELYTKATDAISAIFDVQLICSGDCQGTLSKIIEYATSIGTEGLDEWLADDVGARIPAALYETEQENVAKFMPSCMCSVKFPDIFAGAADSAKALVEMIENLIKEEKDPVWHKLVALGKTFLKAMLGKETGFMSSNGLCTKDCRSMMAWTVKFDLTMLTSIPYQALSDKVADETAMRRLSLIGGRMLGQVEVSARDTLQARAVNVAGVLVKSGTQAFRLLRGSRRLAPEQYKDTIYKIGDSTASCMCEYFDIDKALDISDALDEKFFKSAEDGGEEVWIKILEVAKSALVFFFSQYGMCAGASDGCLNMQTETVRLIGQLEANALNGGVLKSMTLLAEAPNPSLETMLVTVPPCYCSPAIDYNNLFDVYTLWAKDTDNNVPHEEETPTSIVASFMSHSKACLSDECKLMLTATFDFLAGITIGTDTLCTASNALKCLPKDANGCTPPRQKGWMGTMANEMGDDFKTTRALPTVLDDCDSDGLFCPHPWRETYWSACNMRHTCPAVGTSANVITTEITIADAAQVDTQAKRDKLKQNFVKFVNKKANAKLIKDEDVTVTVKNSRRARGRSLAAATVIFRIETTNKLARLQIEKMTASITTADLTAILEVDVSGKLANTEVSAVVYSPPPPAPGYKDNLAVASSDDSADGVNVALIAGVVGGVGGGCCCLGIVLLVFFMVRARKKKTPAAAKEAGL
jgi:hypothetical protein